MTRPAKRFEDAQDYATDIQRLVPGHRLLRELALATLQSTLGAQGSLLVVGAGPGHELVEAADALPGWQLEAVEPSRSMFESAKMAIAAAEIGHRVRIQNKPLVVPDKPTADAVLCLLVAHLIPNDGARAVFWQALGASLRPGGFLVFAEIEEVDEEERCIWRKWSEARGCGPKRLEALDDRLRTGFPLLAPEQTSNLATRAGLVQDGLLLRILGLSLSRWRRPPHAVEQGWQNDSY